MSIEAKRNAVEALDAIILAHRKYLFKEPINEHVVFIMSGGLDSTIGAARTIEEWGSIIHPLFVRRHARATVYEERAFDLIAGDFQERYKRYKGKFLEPKKLEIEVPPTELKSGLTKTRLDKIGHAMRNTVLQSIGVQYAAWLNDNNDLNIRTIMAANVGNDFLPHSSIQAYRTMNILVCTDQNDWSWQIGSPFTEPTLKSRPLFKTDNIKWAVSRNLPLQYTRTCINDCEIADGTCGECIDRLKAFEEAGVEDPVEYQKRL